MDKNFEDKKIFYFIFINYFVNNDNGMAKIYVWSFLYEIDTKVIFNPNHYSETAGVGLYYDSNNWVYLHITYSEITKGPVLSVLQAKSGEIKEIFHPIIEVTSGTVELKIIYNMGFAEM